MDTPTYLIPIDLKRRSFELGKGTVASDTDYMVKTPPILIPANNSLSLTYQIWKDQPNAQKFSAAGATSSWLARPINSPIALTELVADENISIGGTGNYEVTVTIAADLLPALWSNYRLCRSVLRLTATGLQLDLHHDFRVIDHDYLYESAILYSKDYPTSYVDKTASWTLTGYPGLIIYRLDTSAGDIAATLHPAASYPYTRIIILKVSTDANVGSIIPDGTETVNGLAAAALATQTLRTAGSYYELVPDGDGNWTNLNSIMSVE